MSRRIMIGCLSPTITNCYVIGGVITMSGIPAGFTKVAETSVLRDTDHVVVPDAFSKGSIVTYTDVVNVPKGDKNYRLFLFTHERRPGERYGLWSSAQLEALLRPVPFGTRVFIRYEGLQPNPRIDGGKVHVWTIAREGAQAPSDAGDAWESSDGQSTVELPGVGE